MPAYFPSSTLSDVSNTYMMSCLNTPNNTLIVSVASLGTTTIDFITAIPYPNNNNYTTSAGTVVITHSVTNKNLTIAAQLHRVNSAGTIQASGTAAAAQTNAATNTFNALDEPTWSTNCSDRIMLRLTYVNSQMSIQSSTISTNISTTYLLSTIPHNGGTCPVLRKPSWVISKSY